jgi:acyl transferase domain-containing protein
MRKRTVFMYSGQGSQYFHMVRELYDHSPRFRLWMDHCDEVASAILGRSLLDAIFDPRVTKSDPFDALADSNAALICVEYSLTRLVQEMGHRADVLVGYSLGEITAAVVAEVVSLELGLTLAIELARLIESQTPRSGMLAVVGSTELLQTHASLFSRCWVTGINFRDNFVVSGRVADIDELQRSLTRDNVLCQRLPVNYGVHTELIDAAELACRRLLGKLSFAPPNIPIVSSVSTGLVTSVTADTLWAAVRLPVRFAQTIENMLAEGDSVFIDLGPSATLATFVKYLLPPGSQSAQVSTINRFGNDVKAMNEFAAQMARL